MHLFDIKSIYYEYESFKELKINHSSKLFRYSELMKVINLYKKNYFIDPIGYSIENKKIFKIIWGFGKIKVFIWSQMHGNETTGTKSMFDVLNFFSLKRHQKIVEFLRKNITIFFIPMLNPDGSEFFKRRNSINIDLNRDALALISPEIKILFREIQKESPHVLFNLHDQRSIYNVGHEKFNPAILSFLSPKDKGIFSIKKMISMGIINKIKQDIEKVLPNIGSIGRYTDKYYPTATGDVLQNSGYPCILFEAGNYPGDIHKNIVRKYNTLSILSGLSSLASNYYKIHEIKNNKKDYFSILENEEILLDKIYRKVKIKKNRISYLVDIGFMNFEEFDYEKNKLKITSKIVEIGDLSHFFGYEDIDLTKNSSFYNKYSIPDIGYTEK